MGPDDILAIGNGLDIRLSDDMVKRLMDDEEAMASLQRSLAYASSEADTKGNDFFSKVMRPALLGALCLSGAAQEPIDIRNPSMKEAIGEVKRLPYLRPGELNLYIYGSCKAIPYYVSILFSRLRDIVPEEEARKCLSLMERLSSHPRYFRVMDHDQKMVDARPVISALARLKDATTDDKAKDDLMISLCILLFNIIPSPGLIRYMAGLKPADATIAYELYSTLSLNYLLMGDAGNAGLYASRSMKVALTDEKRAYTSLLMGCIRITEGRPSEAASILERYTGAAADMRIWSMVQFYLGVIYHETGDEEKALQRFRDATQGMIDDVDVMGSCVNAASCALAIRDADAATTSLYEALDAGRLTEGNTSKALKVAAFSMLGIAHFSHKESTKALECFRTALSLSKELRYKKGIADSLANIGLTFKHVRDYRSALDYFKSALSYASGAEYPGAVLFSIGQIEQVLSFMGSYDEADSIRKDMIRRHPQVSGLLSRGL